MPIFGFDIPRRVPVPPALAVNAVPPPWAYTFTRQGSIMPAPFLHTVIGHPNPAHRPAPAASPFPGTAYERALNARARRHTPRYPARGGLRAGNRR